MVTGDTGNCVPKKPRQINPDLSEVEFKEDAMKTCVGLSKDIARESETFKQRN